MQNDAVSPWSCKLHMISKPANRLLHNKVFTNFGRLKNGKAHFDNLHDFWFILTYKRQIFVTRELSLINACCWRVDHEILIYDGERTLQIQLNRITHVYIYHQRGAVVEWLEQLGYGVKSRRIA